MKYELDFNLKTKEEGPLNIVANGDTVQELYTRAMVYECDKCGRLKKAYGLDEASSEVLHDAIDKIISLVLLIDERREGDRDERRTIKRNYNSK